MSEEKKTTAAEDSSAVDVETQGGQQAEEATEEVLEETTEETTEGAESEGADEEAAEETKEKKSFFKKKDKEKEKLREQVDSLQDQVRRQMAEFDNYRKRTEKEKDMQFSSGEKSVLEKMLPVIDNFERGFDTVQDEDKDDAFVLGMKKIYDQLMKQMTDLGVTPIEAVGKDFDPTFHNAVMQVESGELESGKVAQELQKGYMYHDTVLRHSMVSVVS